MLRLFSVQCLPTLRRGALLPFGRSCHVAPLGDTQRLGGVVSHSKLLRKVLQGNDPDYVKGRRIRGTVRKIEGSYMNWLGQCGQGECLMMLSSLAMSARFLERREHGASGFNCDDEWSGVSPFFSPGVNDWLCALLQRCASQVESPEECMQLLSFAVDLELGDTQTLQKLCHKVTAKDYIASASPEKLVGVLRLLSLLVKRCRMPVPPLDKLLCRLIGATLDSRQALTVLSSMLRLRERKSVDVVQSVSRKAADMVLTYTAKDVIYALEAVALLNCCHEAYAGAVLRRCCVLCPTLTSGELGSVCKYVALLNTTRTSNTIAFSCAQELRRLLPAILNRAELLLGKFSLRDARCVLRCLKQHNVHHAIVFSRLTPLITDGVKPYQVAVKMLEDEGAAECLSDSRDSLYKRLQVKHAELRVNHLVNLRKTLEIENAAASKKFHKMPMSLDLISDEINLALSEITVRCEEHGVPQISHLVKEVRTMMNRQLREAYGHIEAGYKSAFHKLRETSEVQDRRHERTTVAEELNSKPREVAEPNDSVPPVGGEQCLNDKKADKNTDKRNTSGQKILSLTEAVSATTTFFAESIAVLLRCEIVRVYLYDDYGNLNLCARFPCDVTKGDPISGTNLERMLSREIHQTVCQKCIAVNGKERHEITISERDRKAEDEELEQSGWKAMTSCLIFPIISIEHGKASHGMIHAMNKQGCSTKTVGEFDEDDEALLSAAARLLGCLISRYPAKYFRQQVSKTIHHYMGNYPQCKDGTSHLPPLIEDEVEDAAVTGNKAVQMKQRVLIYRAPINAIYQARSIRRKTRKLEVLHMADRALYSVAFDISALEELWRVGHEENRIMYEHCQQANEQLNILQLLLQNVLDGIGASRNIKDVKDMIRYLRVLELYARQENIPQIRELISQALLKSFPHQSPGQANDLNCEPMTADEALIIQQRLDSVPTKLMFGAAPIPQVRTYSCNPQMRRVQTRYFNELMEKRSEMLKKHGDERRTSGHGRQTISTLAKRIKTNPSLNRRFGNTDYASRRPFKLEDD